MKESADVYIILRSIQGANCAQPQRERSKQSSPRTSPRLLSRTLFAFVSSTFTTATSDVYPTFCSYIQSPTYNTYLLPLLEFSVLHHESSFLSGCYSAPAWTSGEHTQLHQLACSYPLTLVGRVVFARTRGVTVTTRLPLSYPSPLVNSAAKTSSITDWWPFSRVAES